MLLYQPKVDTWTGRVLSVEALIRWNHPVRGLVPPIAFIPVAEETGLITELDTFVLQTACRQARDWALSGLNRLPIAVNVSGHDLHSGDLLERVRGRSSRRASTPAGWSSRSPRARRFARRVRY